MVWAEQVAAKLSSVLGTAFVGLFDLTLDCDELEAAGAAGAWAEEFLGSGEQEVLGELITIRHASCIMRHAAPPAGEELPPGAAAGQQAALQALQYHVQVAQALPPPQLTASAVQILSAYFLSRRTSGQDSQVCACISIASLWAPYRSLGLLLLYLRHSEPSTGTLTSHAPRLQEVGLGLTGTLVRLASASARLRHRLQVEPADAALAVALAEESALAKARAQDDCSGKEHRSPASCYPTL